MSDAMKLYDAGLLGGGHLPNADWWQDYLRAEIERANDFCGEQYEHLCADLAAAQERADRYLRHLTAGAQKIREVESALAAAQEREQRMREALDSIAAWDDHGANRALERDGTYGRFDEPGSVQIARAALGEPQ